MELKVKVGIRKELNGYSAWFKIGNQTFHLQGRDTKEEAKWYAEQLTHAFKVLIQNVKSNRIS